MFTNKTGIVPILLLFIIILFSFKEETDTNNTNGEKNYFLNQGLHLKDKGKTDSALLFFKKAKDQYHTSGNYYSETNCSYYLGCIYEQKKDYTTALQYFTEANYAITKFKISHPLQTDILYKISKQYFVQNKFEESYKITNQSLKENGRLKTSDSTLAAIYHQKGIIEYYKGDYNSAIISLQKSADLGCKAFGQYSLFVSDQINNLGVMNFMIDRVDDALMYYQKSESIMKLGHISSPAGLAATYTNIGIIFRKKNDFENALLFYQKALDLSLPNQSNARNNIANIYINIGSVYRLQNNYKKEFENLNKALIFSNKYYPVIIPKVYQQLAIYYTEVKNFEKAEFFYDASIKEAKLLFSDNPEIAYYYINYGQFQAERKNFDKSLEAFQKALPLYIKFFGKRHSSTSVCLFNISNYFFSRNQQDKALYYIHQAIISNCKDFNNPDIFSIPDADQSLSSQLTVELLDQKTKIIDCIAGKKINKKEKLQLQYVLWNTYHLALKTIEKIRAGYINEDSRMFLYENEYNIYSKALNCALQLYLETKKPAYLEQAFVIVDKTHASSLQSALKEKELPKNFKLNDPSLVKENKLKEELSFYQELLTKERFSKEPDSLRINFWSGKTTDLTFQLEQLLTQLKISKPAWYQYKYLTNENDLIPQVQANLKPNEAIIEYFYNDSSICSFYVDNKKLQFQREPLPSNFDDYLKKILSFVQQPKVYISDSTYYLNYRYAAWELYKLLVKPYEAEIRNKKLIIVPFEKLTYIPFETLLTHETQSKPYNFRELPYLIKQNSIRYLYAANLLNLKKITGLNVKMAAYAPTYSLSTQPDKAGKNKTNGSLKSLTETSDEVRTISNYFPGKVYTAKLASEENFKKNALRYNTLHLAMHAVIDDETPLYSRLVFTPKSSTSEDDLLYTYEIPNLKLNADLVVLSACNTGIGKLRKGEGMMSLTRSFAYAGVPSVVMTLWSVNDNSSSSLMKKFYRSLSSNNEKDVALSNAKLEYFKNSDIIHSHPYYWAGYILIGDNSPIKKPFNTLPAIVIAFIIVGVLIAFVVKKKKQTKQS